MNANIQLQDVSLDDLGEIMGPTSALITTAKILKHQSYYRSRLYTSQTGVNPLVAAAHPIFSVIERINLGENALDLSPLQDNLLHELKAFITRAQADDYNNETVAIAHYLLSVTMDEAIKKSLARNNDNAASLPLPLFALPYVEDNNPEQRFFQIVERILVKPDTYLDLIELLYLCLRSGFEGKFLNQPHHKPQLDDILEKVYQVIKHYRKDTDETLFIATVQSQLFINPKPFPWKLLAMALSLILLLSYLIMNYLLNHQAATIVMQLANLASHNQYYNY